MQVKGEKVIASTLAYYIVTVQVKLQYFSVY